MSNTPKIDELLEPLKSLRGLTTEESTRIRRIDFENAKDQLYQLILEVIEPDENEINIPHRANAVSRNNLRQEQRTKLAHLFNIKETKK